MVTIRCGKKVRLITWIVALKLRCRIFSLTLNWLRIIQGCLNLKAFSSHTYHQKASYFLSTDIAGQNFDPGDPRNHLSYTAFKSFQWQDVLSSVQRETDWLKQPLLLFRYAEACFKLQNELEGLERWFMLFMIYFAEAEQNIDKTCNRLLLADWQFFRELDPELDTLLFPAWMLLNKPALAKHAFVFDSECDGDESFHLISQLLFCAEGGLSEEAIQLRAKLKLKNPGLFIHLMKTVEDEKEN